MRFLYLRDPHGHPIAVLATAPNPLTPSDAGIKEIMFALATCNPLDRFNREHGKSLAAGRLFTAPLGAIAVTNSGTKKNVLTWLIANKKTPQRARDAARRLLASLNYLEAVTLESQEKEAHQSRGPKVVDTPLSLQVCKKAGEQGCDHPKTSHFWHGTQSKVLWGYCTVEGCQCSEYQGPGADDKTGWDKGVRGIDPKWGPANRAGEYPQLNGDAHLGATEADPYYAFGPNAPNTLGAKRREEAAKMKVDLPIVAISPDGKKMDGPVCNCMPGRRISGLKWHSVDTTGCIKSIKYTEEIMDKVAPLPQADGHVEVDHDLDRFHDEGGANHAQAH